MDDGVPDGFMEVLAECPDAAAIAFVGVLIARVLDRRLGELALSMRPRPRPKTGGGTPPRASAQ